MMGNRAIAIFALIFIDAFTACADSDGEADVLSSEAELRCSKTASSPKCDVPPPPPPESPRTVYVSLTGSDANAGTTTAPVRTIQKGVQLANAIVATNADARVSVAAGTYRESVSLTSQAGTGTLTIEGAGPSATILTGADDLSSGWTAVGDGTYTRPWTNRWGMKALPTGWEWFWSTSSNPDKDTLRRYEVMYFDDSPLQPTLSLSRLVPGRFFVDEVDGVIHLSPPSSMAGAAIEMGMRNLVLSIVGRSRVTIRSLAVQRNRGAVQDGMIALQQASAITFDAVLIRHAAYTGLAPTGPAPTIRNSTLTANGVNAYADYKTTGLVIENTTISYNNWRMHAVGLVGWDRVFKIFRGRDATMRRVSWIHNNGSGLWLDSDNANIVVEDSLMAYNAQAGVSLEKNQGPITIRRSRICNNVGGINDAQSDNVTIAGNQIFGNKDFSWAVGGNYAGQTWTIYDTGESYTGRTRSWSWTGNTIVGNGTATGQPGGGWLLWHTDWNAPGAWAATRNSLVAFDGNTWYHANKTSPFTMPGGPKTYEQFRADLRLANSTFESSSVFANPGVLTCALP